MKFQALALTGLLVTSLSLQAQPIKFSLNAKHLSKDVSAARASAMLKTLKPLREKRINKQKKLREALMEKVSGITEPARAALLKAANSSSSLKRMMASYQAESRVLSKLNGKKQKRELKRIQAKYRPLFRELFKRAKINERAIQKEVELAVADSAMAADGELENRYLTVQWSEFLTLILQWIYGEQPEETPAQDPLLVTLEPPFPNTQISESSGGSVTIDVEEPSYSVFTSNLFVSGSESLGGLGHFFRIPGDFSEAKVTAALPDLTYNLFTVAFGGAAGSYANSTVDVLSNNDIVCSETFDHGLILSLVFWVNEQDGTDTFNVSCDFEAPAQEEEIVLSFYSTAGTWGAVIGGANSRVTASPRDLVVRLEP